MPSVRAWQSEKTLGGSTGVTFQIDATESQLKKHLIAPIHPVIRAISPRIVGLHQTLPR